MKKILLILSFLSGLCIAGRTQTNLTDTYALLSDSNGMSLPGQYMDASNILNLTTARLPAGAVLTNQFVPGTNSVATNAAAQLAAYSNYVAAALTPFQTDLLFPAGTNAAVLASYGSTAAGGGWSMPGSIIAGGMSNYLTGSGASGVFAGVSNSLTDGNGGVILGGLNCRFGVVMGDGSADVAGLNNILYDSAQSVILGGWNNTIGGAYSLRGVIFPPLGNTPANCSVAGGVCAWATNNSCFVWADNQGTNAWFFSTTTNQFLIRAFNGVGINTNNCGTNSLEVAGNADFANLSLGGTYIFTLLSTVALSNSLSALFNYDLNVASNYLQAQIVSGSNYATAVSNLVLSTAAGLSNSTAMVSNQAWAFSNALAADQTVSSNALQAGLISVSNLFTAGKRLSFTLPSTYAAQGVAFSAPYMPDGNYSVAVCPQDSTTAGVFSAFGGESYWVSSKLNTGFTLNILFATNTDLHFDITVGENTQ